MAEEIYEIEVEGIDGATYSMDRHRNKVILVVNTASRCGFTPQYAGLEKLYANHGAEGLVVLGFPCNQFGEQEPGANEEISAFCQRNYGVSFPMHAKVKVNGKDAHPLFQLLQKGAPGLLGTEKIKWNFTKFLISRDGNILKRYGPRTTPSEIAPEIETALSDSECT